jgi:hypothetical protein
MKFVNALAFLLLTYSVSTSAAAVNLNEEYGVLAKDFDKFFIDYVDLLGNIITNKKYPMNEMNQRVLLEYLIKLIQIRQIESGVKKLKSDHFYLREG